MSAARAPGASAAARPAAARAALAPCPASRGSAAFARPLSSRSGAADLSVRRSASSMAGVGLTAGASSPSSSSRLVGSSSSSSPSSGARASGSGSSSRASGVVSMAASGAVSSLPVDSSGPSRFLREHLVALAPYTPIEPFHVLSAKLGRPAEEIVKLDANENPYGPPPEVHEALVELSSRAAINIYPDPESRRLRAALGAYHGVDPSLLMVGAGADELLDFLMRCTLEPGDCIVDCPPTFTMYRFDAAVNAARVISVPRVRREVPVEGLGDEAAFSSSPSGAEAGSGAGSSSSSFSSSSSSSSSRVRVDPFALDVEAIERAVLEHRPKLLFLTSPNNPDGGVICERDLLRLLDLPVLVVLDEAYVEFSDEPSRLGWPAERDNLVVLRTFSKSAALAGMRVGFASLPPSLAATMWRAKQPYNLTAASEAAALAALSNPAYLSSVRDALVAERDALVDVLRAQPFLTPFPSHSNFVLAEVDPNYSLSGAQIRDALAKDHGICIRHYSSKELAKYIRVSVGRPDQTQALARAFEQFPKI